MNANNKNLISVFILIQYILLGLILVSLQYVARFSYREGQKTQMAVMPSATMIPAAEITMKTAIITRLDVQKFEQPIISVDTITQEMETFTIVRTEVPTLGPITVEDNDPYPPPEDNDPYPPPEDNDPYPPPEDNDPYPVPVETPVQLPTVSVPPG